jgi:protein SCO1/2
MVAGLVGAAFGIAAGIALIPGVRERVFAPAGQITIGEARVGGPFALIDGAGNRVASTEFIGRPVLLTFAYSRCGIACGATLQLMAAALAEAGADAADLAPIVIGIDPARDTPAGFRDYVTAIDPKFQALSGDAAAIARVTEVYHAKFATERDASSGAVVADLSARSRRALRAALRYGDPAT